jgi:hypothetical protein
LFGCGFVIPGLQDFCFSTKMLDFIHFPENGGSLHGVLCVAMLGLGALRILGMWVVFPRR